MRGEYPPWSATTGARMELPPRARRIPHTVRNQNGQGGTTSACAENTGLDSMLQGLQGNYLRVRGEYATCGTLQALSPELPPRARRILHDESHVTHLIGTTSACAENTVGVGVLCASGGNYLRVRGEYAPARPLGIFSSELPPRARRIPAREVMAAATEGTTSACAENTA